MTKAEARKRLPEGWSLHSEWEANRYGEVYWCEPQFDGWHGTAKYLTREKAVAAAIRLHDYFQYSPHALQDELFEQRSVTD